MSEKTTGGRLKRIGEVLHQRLVDGDVTATAEIAEVFMPIVAARLKRRYSDLDDPHLVDTAVEDALLSYFKRPQQYDPAKLRLEGYLYMSARGDLLNQLERQERDSKQVGLAEVVELGDSDTEHGVEVKDELDIDAIVLNYTSPVWERLSEILPDFIDQEIVLLMMDGVRETSVYADVLGVSDYPPEEQFTIVKRHKDRVKKRLQRNLERTELSKNG
jgi:hypothetical protein